MLARLREILRWFLDFIAAALASINFRPAPKGEQRRVRVGKHPVFNVRAIASSAIALIATFTSTSVAVSQQVPDNLDGPASASHPMLEALDRETEALYRDVNMSVVRVQLPKPQWMNDYAMAPMNRDRLDPQFRKRLEQGGQPPGVAVVLRPGTTVPASQPSDAPSTQPVLVEGHGTIVFVPTQGPAVDPQTAQRDPVLGGRLKDDVNTVTPFTPNNIGILLDDAGHILVPLYVERETCAATPVRIAMNDGKVLEARFVGSDLQTNLTLLQADKPAGRAVQFAARRPMNGSLVLFISTMDGSGRLGLWNGGQHDMGIVFATDGGVAGIARYGQFLSATAFHLIAEQLINFGAVKRATLGVIVTEIRKDDPLREQSPILGSRTAMRIDEVMPHSVADNAGLKQGDLLLALAGESVSDIPSLAAAIASRNGATELQVLRGSEVLKVVVDLQQHK